MSPIMLTIRGLLSDVREHYNDNNVTIGYRYPMTIVTVRSADFENQDTEEREQSLVDKLDIDLADLRICLLRSYLRLDLRSLDEPRELQPNRGHYWLRMLLDERPPSASSTSSGPRAIHFYGYKGGQARSSVLTFLARDLADDGWRVLVVDVDAEAPSLPVLLGTAPSRNAETLVGLRAGLEPEPLRALTASGGGYADLLAFSLADENSIPDGAALAMELAMSPPAADELVERVKTLAGGYDVVLLDHRTGMAASVPPWIHGLAGPLVAFARMDGQWRPAAPLLAALWRQSAQSPGLLISFRSDDESDITYVKRVMRQVREALTPLVDAVAHYQPGSGDAGSADEDLSVDDLIDRWVVWPYDSAFRRIGVPARDEVASAVRDALGDIRRLLTLGAPPRPGESTPRLSSSGAIDQGELILTSALRDLDVPRSPYWFILGRKGTGKTRLLRELAGRSRGWPLLVADDDTGTHGIPAGHAAIKALAAWAKQPWFWWHFLAAALTVGEPKREALIKEIERRANAPSPPDPTAIISEVHQLSLANSRSSAFLLDGLETAFSRHETHGFIGEMFRFLAAIRADQRLRDRIKLRIFIRTDLAHRGFENVGQLLDGRALQLSWDTQSILNYALSRIGARTWFQNNFPDVVKEISHLKDEIHRGDLALHRCDALLLKIFPTRLRRQNMLTTTFLRIWFSDDSSGKIGYYPRIYDSFLGEIASPSADFSGPSIKDGLVSDKLMLHAHGAAAEQFLDQVRTELNNLVDLNAEEIRRLLEAFRGQKTPFRLEALIKDLSRSTGIDAVRVRQTMVEMKTLGIFEGRPGQREQWRAGRLFKTSLGMLYNRRRN